MTIILAIQMARRDAATMSTSCKMPVTEPGAALVDADALPARLYYAYHLRF